MKHKHLFRLTILIFSFAILSFSMDVIHANTILEQPKAKIGVLDLTNWNFDQNGPVNLFGEWKFYWKQFLPAEVIDDSKFGTPTGFISIPSYWNDFILDGKPLEGTGYASFLLKVKLPKNKLRLAFKVKDIQTAYRIYVNGTQVAANGSVGSSEASSKPGYAPLVAEFDYNDPELNILVQVSNYHHRKGGIWESIQMGREQDIRKLREDNLTLDLFFVGCILIMGLYHLGLFLHRRQDKSALFFGIFCIDITLRALSTGERYLNQLLPNFDWEWIHKLEYSTFYLGLPLFAMFLHTLFPMEFSKKVLRAIQVVGLIFTGIVLSTSAIFYTHTVQIYQAVTAFCGLYGIYIMIKAINKKREGAFVLLFGFLFLFATVVNDILHVNQVIHTGFLLSFGLFIFIFSQAFLISLRFSTAFQTVEHQTRELISTNQAFREEIKERKILEQNLIETHGKFEKSRIGIIMGLAKLAEYRDEDTGNHLERMREYSKILAIELSNYSPYQEYISEAYIADIYQSAILHDIGKVGIPDSILLKPGKLNDAEFKTIQRHSAIGGDAISNVETRINIQSFLTLGKEIAYNHHEKWDGSGYPFGLKGEKIPLSARIVALADVYDALTSERPYKKPFSHEKAKSIILESNGSHFDPMIVKAFLAAEAEFEKIRQQLLDD